MRASGRRLLDTVQSCIYEQLTEWPDDHGQTSSRWRGADLIPPGSGRPFHDCRQGESRFFNVDGDICAYSRYMSLTPVGSLGMGKLDGRIVTCPVHGMKFDVTNGCFAGTSDFGIAFLSGEGRGGRNRDFGSLSAW